MKQLLLITLALGTVSACTPQQMQALQQLQAMEQERVRKQNAQRAAMSRAMNENMRANTEWMNQQAEQERVNQLENRVRNLESGF